MRCKIVSISQHNGLPLAMCEPLTHDCETFFKRLEDQISETLPIAVQCGGIEWLVERISRGADGSKFAFLLLRGERPPLPGMILRPEGAPLETDELAAQLARLTHVLKLMSELDVEGTLNALSDDSQPITKAFENQQILQLFLTACRQAIPLRDFVTMRGISLSTMDRTIVRLNNDLNVLNTIEGKRS